MVLVPLTGSPLVRSYQTRLLCSDFISGTAGKLIPITTDCTPGPCASYETGVDTSDPNFLLAPLGATISGCSFGSLCPDATSSRTLCFSTPSTPSAVADDGTAKYITTYSFDMSVDADGTLHPQSRSE